MTSTPLMQMYQSRDRVILAFEEAMSHVQTLSILVDDDDQHGDPRIIEGVKVDLSRSYAQARGENLNLDQLLAVLSPDDRAMVPDTDLFIRNQSKDVAFSSIKKQITAVTARLQALLAIQRQNKAQISVSSSKVEFPSEVTDAFKLLATNVTSVPNRSDSSVLGSASTERVNATAWKVYQNKSYPYFDGSFDSYLEWSNVMTKNVLPMFSDMPNLAVLVLRDSLKGSPSSLALIKSVDATTPNPTTAIMDLLKGYWGSKSAMGHYYSSELKKLKPVPENDYASFHTFILNLDRIVQKIIKHDLENFVEPGEVFRLQDCLPPSRRDGFTDKYGELNDDESAHCIRHFLEYVKTLQPAVQKMCTNRGFLKTSAKTKAMHIASLDYENISSNYASDTVESVDQSSDGADSFWCEIHFSDKHDLDQCELFRKRNPKDRSRWCSMFNLCKVCLVSKDHSGKDCPKSAVKCAHCQMNGHHTLLCFKDDVNSNSNPPSRSEYIGERSKQGAPKKKGPAIKQSSHGNSAKSSGYNVQTDHASSADSFMTSYQPESISDNLVPSVAQADVISKPGSNLVENLDYFLDPQTGHIFSTHSSPIQLCSDSNNDRKFSTHSSSMQRSSDSNNDRKPSSVSSGQVVGKQESSSVNAITHRTGTGLPPIRLNKVKQITGLTADSVSTPSKPTTNSPVTATNSYCTVESSRPSSSIVGSETCETENSSSSLSVLTGQPIVGSVATVDPHLSSVKNMPSHSVDSGIVVPTSPTSLEFSSSPTGENPSNRTDSIDLDKSPALDQSQTQELATDLEIVSYSSEVQTPGLYSIYSVPFKSDRGDHFLLKPEQLVKRKSNHPSLFDPDFHLVFFLDGGSCSSFISRAASARIGARLIATRDLTLTTLQGSKTEKTELVSFTIFDVFGQPHNIVAYTRDFICKPPSQIDLGTLEQIFPEMDVSVLQRPVSQVDVLLGADYFGLHAKNEIAANGNLSVMKGSLGLCLQGSHPSLLPYLLHSPTGHCISAKKSQATVSSISGSCFQTDHRFTDSVINDEFVPPLSFDSDDVMETDQIPALSYDTDVDDDPVQNSDPSHVSHGANEALYVIETETMNPDITSSQAYLDDVIGSGMIPLSDDSYKDDGSMNESSCDFSCENDEDYLPKQSHPISVESHLNGTGDINPSVTENGSDFILCNCSSDGCVCQAYFVCLVAILQLLVTDDNPPLASSLSEAPLQNSGICRTEVISEIIPPPSVELVEQIPSSVDSEVPLVCNSGDLEQIDVLSSPGEISISPSDLEIISPLVLDPSDFTLPPWPPDLQSDSVKAPGMDVVKPQISRSHMEQQNSEPPDLVFDFDQNHVSSEGSSFSICSHNVKDLQHNPDLESTDFSPGYDIDSQTRSLNFSHDSDIVREGTQHRIDILHLVFYCIVCTLSLLVYTLIYDSSHTGLSFLQVWVVSAVASIIHHVIPISVLLLLLYLVILLDPL